MDEPISVKNHSVFLEAHLPDLEQDVKDSTVFTWNIKQWSQLARSARYGPVFKCDGHKWRLQLYPFGNGSSSSTADAGSVVSLYLHHSSSVNLPEDWHASVQFVLVISSTQDPTVYKTRHTEHRFCAKSPDWGFRQFANHSELRSVEEGHSGPIMQDDTADITVFVRVLNDSEPVTDDVSTTLPPALPNEPTKIKNDVIEIDYMGIKRKGATSYMNTLIQLLFSIRSLRKAVYEAPTEGKMPTQSTTLALQRIFCRLQALHKCVSTAELTRALGWGDMDALFARDIVDFRRVLLSTLQGTKLDSTIQNLFSGEMKTFIRCININKEYSAVENFDIIQLEVNGVKTLRDSFMKFTESEDLTGKNRYLDPVYGLQEAERGRVFQSLPPILFIQLQRWKHDSGNDTMAKSNTSLEFPFKIDLDEFLDEDADRSQPWVYTLHAVSVHSGDLARGHNYALIRPNKDSEWLKFDDDNVTRATESDVMSAYGTDDIDAGNDNLASAYVLVYIRDSSYDEVGKPVDVEELPDHIKGFKTNVRQTRVVTDPQPEAKIITNNGTDHRHSDHAGDINSTVQGPVQSTLAAPVTTTDTPSEPVLEGKKILPYDLGSSENIPDSVESGVKQDIREEGVDVSQKTIDVIHVTKDLSQMPDTPFKFVVKEGEVFEETKKRLHSMLSVPDDEFSGYKFVVTSLPPTEYLHMYLENEHILSNKYAVGSSLGVVHGEGESTSEFELL